MDRKILHFDYPEIGYLEGLKEQEKLHKKVVSGEIPAAIMTLSHPTVLTLGKHADSDYLLKSRSELNQLGVDVVETDRGGEVTAHMPGQLVLYPILPIKDFRLGPKFLVDNILLGSVVKVLENYGISGSLDSKHPGVWVANQKICAVGIRVSKRVSSHGIALNVNNDLSVFDLIVPCGIRDRGVTSVSRELGKLLSFEEVKCQLLTNIFESLGCDYSGA